MFIAFVAQRAYSLQMPINIASTKQEALCILVLCTTLCLKSLGVPKLKLFCHFVAGGLETHVVGFGLVWLKKYLESTTKTSCIL